jgi:pimeloyl-ACP methyl ester carboxylesterase/acyl carrier protein
VVIDGVRLHFRDNGVEAKDVVVFLHGNSTSSVMFEGPLTDLAATGTRALALDFPGHGASDRLSPGHKYSILELARLGRAFVDGVDAERLVLCGHSLGGHVASHMLEAPDERLTGVVLVSAPPLSLGELGAIFRPDPTFGALFESQLTSQQARAFAECLAPSSRVGALTHERVVAALRETDPAFRSDLGASLGAGMLKNELELLTAARLPVMLCWGDDDPFLHGEYHSKLDPNWERVCFHGSGHSPHLEEPLSFVSVLGRFVAKYAKASSPSANDASEIERRVRALAVQASPEPSSSSAETAPSEVLLREGLGFDSLGKMTLALLIEGEFDLVIADNAERYEACMTLGDIVAFVESLTVGRGA